MSTETRLEIRLRRLDLNKTEAFKLDRAFYSEFDEEAGDYGVFGTETGFCYLLTNKEAAEAEAEKLSALKL